MDDYIPKPIDRSSLYETIERQTRPAQRDGQRAEPMTSTADAVAAGRHPESVAEADSAPAAGHDALPGWDAALERLDGDRELLVEIAGLYSEMRAGMIGELTKAARQRDAGAVERAAHALKGCVSNFGADGAADAAMKIEAMGRAGELTGLEPAMAHLATELTALDRALELIVQERAA